MQGQESNSGPLAFKASTLPVGPPAQPMPYFLILMACISVLLIQSAYEVIQEYLNPGQKVDRCGNNSLSLKAGQLIYANPSRNEWKLGMFLPVDAHSAPVHSGERGCFSLVLTLSFP